MPKVYLLISVVTFVFAFTGSLLFAPRLPAGRFTAQRWRKVYSGRQRPTPDMLEALALLTPHYAF
jgi:hypothetical protein